jgi:hypothetical protein
MHATSPAQYIFLDFITLWSKAKRTNYAGTHHVISPVSWCFPEPELSSRYGDWLRAGWPRSRSSSPGKVKNFPFATASRPVLGPTQPPIHWVLVFISPGINRPGNEAGRSPQTACHLISRWYLARLILRPWRFRWYVHPKRRLTLNGLHGVISQKIVLFEILAVFEVNNDEYFSRFILIFQLVTYWTCLILHRAPVPKRPGLTSRQQNDHVLRAVCPSHCLSVHYLALSFRNKWGPINYNSHRAGFKDCLVGSVTSLFNDTVSNSIIQSQRFDDSDLERIWNEAVVV